MICCDHSPREHHNKARRGGASSRDVCATVPCARRPVEGSPGRSGAVAMQGGPLHGPGRTGGPVPPEPRPQLSAERGRARHPQASASLGVHRGILQRTVRSEAAPDRVGAPFGPRLWARKRTSRPTRGGSGGRGSAAPPGPGGPRGARRDPGRRPRGLRADGGFGSEASRWRFSPVAGPAGEGPPCAASVGHLPPGQREAASPAAQDGAAGRTARSLPARSRRPRTRRSRPAVLGRLPGGKAQPCGQASAGSCGAAGHGGCCAPGEAGPGGVLGAAPTRPQEAQGPGLALVPPSAPGPGDTREAVRRPHSHPLFENRLGRARARSPGLG